MKKLLFLCLLVTSVSQAVEFDLPTLKPQEAIDLASKYLLKEHRIDSKRYSVVNVTYRYVGPTSLSGRWDIFYIAKPDSEGGVAFGDHFNVRIGNGEKPWFQFLGGA